MSRRWTPERAAGNMAAKGELRSTRPGEAEEAERHCSECGCTLTEQEATRCSVCYRRDLEGEL